MGKNTRTTKYGPAVQLLIIAGAIVAPFLAFNLMDLELFSVFKTMFTTLFSSIKPWLCPPYVYLLINFIIFFIAASSSIRSYNPIVFNPPTTETDDHQYQSLIADESFIQTSLVCQSIAVSLDDDHVNFDTLKDPVHVHADEGRSKEGEVASESTVFDKRELRKSKTFHEGVSRPRGRRERYVRILSQEELDRQVEAFIYRCKQDTNTSNVNVHK
ncbi:hypothetical protein Lser_V15G35647 [Lactuca serriola]